jgi:glycosyltransferase involved in cell wall biosynthesis
MSEASLTVSILTYNRKDYLVEALKAICEQSYWNFNVKILDNASTDGTEDVVKPFLSDKRFEYIRHSKNIGGSGNYNFALTHCTTDFLLITHDDDRMKKNMLVEEMGVLRDYPDVNLVCCENDYIDGTGKVLRSAVFSLAFNLGPLFFQDRYDFIKGYVKGLNYISCPTAVLRMTPIRSHGLLFRQDVGPALDTVFWMDLNCLPGRFAFIGESLYEYRMHDLQDSARNTLTIYAGLKEAVWDVLEREKLGSLIASWQRRIDNDVLSLLVSRLKSNVSIDRTFIINIKRKILSRGEANGRVGWILFWASNFPAAFRFVNFIRHTAVLIKKSLLSYHDRVIHFWL